MAFNPTEAQRRAIETRNRSILLSAAAGSGKTATLTRRIISSLIDRDSPLDLSRMLIVTFTRAAAAELRERISSSLTEALADDPADPHLNRQSILIGSADICTIDSFCLDVVRANFQRLTLEDGSPLSPDVRPADDTELNTLRLSVMNAVIDDWYEKEDDRYDFPRFVESFSGTRDEGSLVESLISYSQALDSIPDPDGFTAQMAKRTLEDAGRDFFETDVGAILREYVKDRFEYFLSVADRASAEFSDGGVCERNYKGAFDYDAEFCREVLGALDVSYGATRDVFLSYSPPSLKSLGKAKTERSVSYKDLRDRIKKTVKKIAEQSFALPEEEIADYDRRTARELETLAAVIADFRREYAREKNLRRILEFSDIKRLAHRLLVQSDGSPTEAALELRRRYDAVYIDEYQDVDRVQDEIFSALSRTGCRFVVGDIKQSIYSFRGAEPSVFGSLRDRLPDYGTPESDTECACSIFMSENFRCDAPVIEFVNRVSRHSFVPTGGVVGYRREDDLVLGKKDSGNFPVTAAILPEGELEYIVSEIKRLLAGATKNDGKRVVGSDIAVLCRTNGMLAELASALAREGIESTTEAASDLFENPEILLVLSLVTVIDNPEKDIPLAAVLRSPFFSFTMEELLKIRAESESIFSLYASLEAYASREERNGLAQKCRDFVSRIESLRADSREISVDALVRRIYAAFSVMSLTPADQSRTARSVTTNLRRFYEYARGFAASQSSGLSGFVRYINNIIEGGTRVASPLPSSGEGSVTLMNVHKSKGLEFPIVFLCGCGKGFNRKDLRKTLIFEPTAGVALRLVDDTGFARADTPQRAALTLLLSQKQTEEEMRILYVGLTRARERLYITADVGSEPESQLERAAFDAEFSSRGLALSAKCYLDWLLPAVAELGDRVRLVTELDISDTEMLDADAQEPTEPKDAESGEIGRMLRERFDFVYPHAAESLPAKLSVSRLYPDLLDDDGALTLDVDPTVDPTRRPLFLQETAERRPSAAERGTATHLFMQFCDFARAERSVREELARLTEKRFVPAGISELVNLRQIERFFVSELYSSLKNAKRVWREQRFNLLLPAERFTKNSGLALRLEGESLLVQGVIDLLFIDENDRIVLCDYKTDYLTPDEISDESAAKKKLFDRHRLQLGYYCDAVEQLLGRRPDRVCLSPLPLGRAIEE